MPGGKWNEMCESGGIDHIAIVHEALDGLGE